VAGQILGRGPHRREDAGVRALLGRAPAPITAAFIETPAGLDVIAAP
jgi:hypothetical protein